MCIGCRKSVTFCAGKRWNMFSRNDWLALLLGLAILLTLIFLPVPAHAGMCHDADACGYTLLYMPLAPVATDHFTDSQLTAAMVAAGYDPGTWDQYTSCVLDAASTQAAPLYRECFTALDTDSGTWDAGYVWWHVQQMAANGVQWQVVTLDPAVNPFGGSGITPVKR